MSDPAMGDPATSDPATSDPATAATPARHESLIERHAWKVFAVLAVILVLFGLGDMASGGSTFRSGEVVTFTSITGMTWDELRVADPGGAKLIDSQVRQGGAQLLMIGLLSLAIVLTGFRRGERWAWFAMWLWPLWIGLLVSQLVTTERIPGSGVPVPIISGSIFFVLSVALLALSYRKFFATR